MLKNNTNHVLVAGLERQDALKYMAAVFIAMEANAHPSFSFSYPPGDSIATAKQLIQDQGRGADCKGVALEDGECTVAARKLFIRCSGAQLSLEEEALYFDAVLLLADTTTWLRWDRFLYALHGHLRENAPIALLVSDQAALVQRFLSCNSKLAMSAQLLIPHDSYRTGQGRTISESEIKSFDQDIMRKRLSKDEEFMLLTRKLRLTRGYCHWFSSEIFLSQPNDYGQYPIAKQDAYEEAFLWLLAKMDLYPHQV